MDKNKSAIWITGASSGIGKAAAKEFARIGCRVFVSARRVTELERLNEELSSDKLSVEIMPCNVASSQNVDQVYKKISAEQKIDCLINNAGVTSFKLAEDNSITEINDVINTNLLGSIYCIKSVLPDMISNSSGTIINILSIVTQKIFSRSSVYAASKYGLMGYADFLREEVRDHNIRVINVIPGATETSMWPLDIRKDKADKMMTSEDIGRLLVWLFLQEGTMVTESITLRPQTGDLK